VSGVLKIQLKFDASGPLADGAAAKLTETWTENTTQALADAGVEMLRAFPMDKSGKAAGAFQANLHTVRRSLNEVRVPGPNIKGVAWAPWLEGTSTRNQGNKFKGYHLFRKTRLALQKMAPEIGQAELDKLMPMIGGE
jgi:hypothetical protein